MMDNFKCFRNDEPIPCEELCDNNLKIYFYQFGLFIIILFFIVLIRPVVNYFIKHHCCIRQQNNSTVESITNTQQTQCDIDVGIQRIVINPDQSLNLSEIN